MWAEIKVDFRSEKHHMAVDRSVGVLDELSFDGSRNGGSLTYLDGYYPHYFITTAYSQRKPAPPRDMRIS